MSSIERIPPDFRQGAQEAALALQGADDILIAAHVNPDGDAIGAMLACAAMLEHLGKQYALYIPQGIPRTLAFLQASAPVYSHLQQLPFPPRWAVYLDCSEKSRLGNELAHFANDWSIINIDHHICEHGLGNVANFITTRAAATCQLMAYVAHALDLPLSGALGQGIAVGLLTDTGHFSHGNTSAEVFDLAAQLERAGVSMSGLEEQLRASMSLNRLQLFGALFGRTRQTPDGRLAWVTVYQEDLRAYGCASDELEGLVEWLRRLNGVQIALLIREQDNGSCKFSLRSRGNTDVQGIAASLGGGGHKNAAGGTLACSPDAGAATLIQAVAKYLQTAPNAS